MWAGTPCVFAARARAWAWLPWRIIVSWLSHQRLGRHTTAVSCDARLPHAFDTLLLNQSAQSVESSPSFEGANLLLVLAFEEQLDFRIGRGSGSIALHFVRVRCWLAGYIRPGTGTSFGSRRRCNLVYCLTGDRGCPMNVFLDSLVSSLYR
jgi:hypothetical protein